MAQILQPYKVPVVFNDLAPEEAVTDAFYALETLSATIDDIFGRIEKRISDERRRVDHIRSRVANCQNKVHQVRGSKKATTVFSTAKFPAPKTLPSYPTLFSQIHELRSPFREADEEVQYLPPHPAHSVVGNRELYGELQDIVVRLNTYGTDLERVEFTMEDDGLGKLPHDIPSVGSLLLFNSSINPYKEYQTLDNLVSAGREKQAGDDDAGKQLANAPSTILSGDALPDIAGLDLTFKPSMGEMSQLALPENLPLDFIANINFTAGVDLPSIAPSAHMANRANYNLPQLTDGRSAGTASSSAYAPPPSAKASTAPPPPPPPVRTAAPPPPPPPAPAPAPSAAGPPPPPAPVAAPASAVTAPAAATQQDEEKEPPAAGAAGGGRQGLSFLDAIKGMSVSKLRSKEESAMAAAKVQKKVEQTKPLSMAEALKERLARRNEALSGKNDKEEKRRDSLIVQAARTQQEQQRQTAPAASAAPKKTSALLSLGFAAVADKGNDSDDDGFNYAKPGFAAKRGADSDDTESDTVSEFSEDSRAYSVQGSSAARPFATSPMNSKPAPAPAPRVPSAAAAPPPPSRRGTGLLGSAQVDSMLSQTHALRKKPTQDGSDEDDDWD